MITVAIHKRAMILALAAALMLGGGNTSADAVPHHPTGDFARFADCPLSPVVTENCMFANVNSGTLTIGRRTIPISKTIVLQGGFHFDSTETELVFVGAEDGNTLGSTPLSVPGGLAGLVPAEYMPRSLQMQAGASAQGVTLTLQLAAPASTIGLSTTNFLLEEGIALRLPVEVKLNNPFLGNNCYVGSFSSPVLLNMTTGTTSPPAPNKPIKGAAGSLEFLDEFFISVLGGGARLVDNSFAVPQATGCGGMNASIVDRALDAAMGLPSPAGHSLATLGGKFYVAAGRAVKETE